MSHTLAPPLILTALVLALPSERPAHARASARQVAGSALAALPARRVSGQWAHVPPGAPQSSFEENRGQVDPRVRFLRRGAGHTLFLTAGEAVLVIHSPAEEVFGAAEESAGNVPSVLRMRFAGADAGAELEGVGLLTETSHFPGRSDPGLQDVRHFAAVRYGSIHPGIDLVFRGGPRRFEYDFVVAPHADPSPVRLLFEGTSGVELGEEGRLLLHTPAGDVVQRAPHAFQETGDSRREVTARFVLDEGGGVGFALGPYDRERPLTIDPVIEFEYSGYFGGSYIDHAESIAVDAQGRAYVVGGTSSDDFPVEGTCPLPDAGNQGVLVRLAASGATDYSSYLPPGFYNPTCVAVDDVRGRIAIVSSVNPGTPLPPSTNGNAVQDGLPAFIDHCALLVMSADGCEMVYDTFLTGSYGSVPGAVAFDAEGKVCVTGRADGYGTVSNPHTDFLEGYESQIQPYRGTADLFVARIDPDATLGDSSLLYFTFLGGSSTDYAGDLAVAPDGKIVVVGSTRSVGAYYPWPITNDLGFAGSATDYIAFVAEIDPTVDGPASLVFSLVLSAEAANAVAVDGDGHVFVTGATSVTDFFPDPPGYDKTRAGTEAYVVELTPDGSAMPYATYLGGSGADYGYGIALGPGGEIFVAGTTTSADFPQKDSGVNR